MGNQWRCCRSANRALGGCKEFSTYIGGFR
ncbi:MAG: hypothetical protein DMG48_05725 [Acidobacteria bacterium]|nr:MAG: hypothetical protein DMG48_05725 [Acidobacteriota bacterium]